MKLKKNKKLRWMKLIFEKKKIYGCFKFLGDSPKAYAKSIKLVAM
jgi:hypothetical protein